MPDFPGPDGVAAVGMGQNRAGAWGTSGWLVRLEGFLLQTVTICLLLLVVIQGLGFNETTGLYFGYGDWLEGSAPPRHDEDNLAATFLSPSAADILTVSITLINEPAAANVALSINGVVAATFATPQITIEVHPGDELVLDGRATDQYLIFRITDTSPGLTTPREGTQVIIQGDTVPLGTVQP